MSFSKRFDASFAAPPERIGSTSDAALCRNYLRLIDAVPSEVAWNVVALHRHVLVADSRDEATTVIMEAIASQFGTIVTTQSLPSRRRNHGPLLGCLLSVSCDADEIEGRLRAAYWQATEPCGNGGNQPF